MDAPGSQIVTRGEMNRRDLELAYMRLSYPTWYVASLAGLILALVAFVIWATLFGPDGARGIVGSWPRAALFGLLVASIAYSALVGPSRTRGLARKTWSRDPEAWRRARFAFDEAGVTAEIGERIVVYGWDEVHTMVDTRGMLLLFYDAPSRFGFFQGTFLPVPKRLLHGNHAEAEVVRMARDAGVTVRTHVPWHSRATRAS